MNQADALASERPPKTNDHELLQFLSTNDGNYSKTINTADLSNLTEPSAQQDEPPIGGWLAAGY